MADPEKQSLTNKDDGAAKNDKPQAKAPTKRPNSKVQPKEVKVAKKKRKVASEKPNFSNYNKKEILKHLKENGCNRKDFERMLNSFKVPKEMALSYLNQHMRAAEENVRQECESLSFENITGWLSTFKDWQLPERCSYESALVVNAIVNNEEQPNPNELGGIDLKSIYAFLNNALLGLPQTELSPESAKFLNDEFELLIDEANTDTADVQTRQLKLLLQNVTIRKSQRISFDPFLLYQQLNK